MKRTKNGQENHWISPESQQIPRNVICNPPTVVLLRHDGPSMTLLPSGRASPFAVLCFPSVALARKYQKVCRIKPKKFPIKHLSIPEWVKMLKRMKKRDVHFAAIVLRMENGQVLKAGVEIDQILATHDDPNSVLFGA